MPGPTIAITAITSTMNGNAIIVSTIRASDRVDHAAEVAGNRADQHPDDQRRIGDQQDHRQVEAQGIEGAAEHVAAGAVGSKQMSRPTAS